MPVIMGTAGHIDHGKTSLIKALTGIDCDRLDEEKKRGITIELGFAFLDLPGPEGADNRLSIVDVPGHERFVKNMVSGAAGIDFVLLVIAADEGVMPQTREHLEICSLLGISTGLVALTKTDMVDQDWLDMVTEDVREYLGNTFLADAPMFPVSSRTGEGVEELRAGLAELAGKFQPRRRSDLFRLPVDRVFTMKGHGTVVTGTMISGRIAVGEDVTLYPSGKAAKVRNLQSHGRAVEEAPAGRRTAVNLQGLEVEDVDRGEVLARPGTLFPAKAWDVVLTCLSSSPLPLKHRKQVHFHHGSREVMARVHLLDREALEPGETGVVKMVFESPMAGVFGDRVVLRSFSPLRTMAGGTVVNPESRKIKRFSDGAAVLRSLAEPGVETAEVALAQLSFAGPEGLRFAELAIMTNAESKELEKVLNDLSGKRKALLFDKEERRYVHGEVFQAACDSVLRFLEYFHKREPMKPGVGKSEVESSLPAKPGKRLPSKLFHLVVERLIRDGEIETGQEVIFRAGHTVSLASDQEALRAGILKAFAEGGALPPNMKDVLEEMGVTENEAKPVIQLLTGEGKLVRLKAGMFYDAAALEALKESIVAWTEEHGELGPGDLKGFTGLTRKYAIPVLEYLDEARITIRVGDKRVLRKRQENGIMKLFLPPIEIGPDEGFTEQNDLFRRKEFGQGLANLITRVKEPLVLALDAPWGEGKTTFIKQWQGLLRTDYGVESIYFDAFKNDYQNDPFVVITNELYHFIAERAEGENEDGPTWKERKDKLVGGLKKWSKVGLRIGLEVGVRTATAGLVGLYPLEKESENAQESLSEAISKEAIRAGGDVTADEIERFFSKQNEIKQGLEDVHRALESVAKDLAREGKPLVFSQS